MAKARRDDDVKLEWQEVDADTLPTKEAKLYKDYKAKQAAASAARNAFDDAFKAIAAKKIGIAKDQHIVVAHKFGKLSIAVAEGTEGAKRSGSKFKIHF